jgi:ribose transport system ATP-binding protein
MATALHVSHVAKGFAGVPVLRDISFDLHAGELTVLAGENVDEDHHRAAEGRCR